MKELLNNGYTQDQIDKGDHLPTAGGGAPDTVGTKEGAEKDTDHSHKLRRSCQRYSFRAAWEEHRS